MTTAARSRNPSEARIKRHAVTFGISDEKRRDTKRDCSPRRPEDQEISRRLFCLLFLFDKYFFKNPLTNAFYCDTIYKRQTASTHLAELCKGSTADSDSVCLGSNPSSAAKEKRPSSDGRFFFPLAAKLSPEPSVLPIRAKLGFAYRPRRYPASCGDVSFLWYTRNDLLLLFPAQLYPSSAAIKRLRKR